ncbi:hypothetical protein [Nocardioides antri]|uniref:hypothetical protein n=1 Tax=Nocardioides antri TaxID=2607659 RepID=UPI00165F25E5|nr:hypothetical protein [Nocardioides antri]
MAFIVNEATGDFAAFPRTNIEVDADEYLEEGSYTVFYKSDEQVFSMKTEDCKTIRKK